MENQIVKATPHLLPMILEKASKVQLIEQFSSLTLPIIVERKYPTIGALEKVHGKEVVQTAMAIIVSDLNTSFSGDLTKDDIEEIVAEIKSSITRNITMEGLYLVCNSIKKSGTFKLKVNTVLKAVNDHLEEQSNAIQKINYNAHLQTKFTTPRISDQVLESDNAYRSALIEYTHKNLQKP